TVSAKQPKSKPAVEKESKPTPASKSKASKKRHSKAPDDKPSKPNLTKEKSTKTTLPQSTDTGKVVKVCKAKSQLQLIDEPDEEPDHSEPKPKLVHQASPFHLAEEDFKHDNLKFVPKGEIDEVFGMPILDELISNNIKNAPYYNAYLEMVAKHDQKVAA
nr:hypothetical protein [Tanacetum cinerariifolium]